MSSKLPRTRKNYPNQSLSIGIKVKPEVYDWIDEAKWTYRDTRGGFATKMVMFAYENMPAFEKYYQESISDK